MGESLVILGTQWVASEPFVLIKDGAEDLVRRVRIPGFRFGYRARPDLARVCLGHRLEEGDAVCGRPVQTGTKTCRSCAIESALFASDLHHAHTRQPSGALADHLDQPNVLYLAGFGDGSVKVGTSVSHRVETRLLEQGARRARIVGRTEDGVTVRVLEDLITETLEIAQTVSVSRKLKGLTDPKPDSQLSERLNGIEAKARRFLDDVEGWKPLEDTWSNPILGEAKWRGVFAYPRDLAAGAHDLVARGACGRIALLSRSEPGADRFVADLRQLYGVRLERGVFETPGLAAQHSLF